MGKYTRACRLKSKKEEKWYTLDQRKPEKYQLVTFLFKDERQRNGWWTGSGYDGPREIKESEIVAWRLADPVCSPPRRLPEDY